MSSKAIGMIILFAGICVMIATASNVFSVFTGKSQPISLFHLPALKMDPAAFVPKLPGGISAPPSGTGNMVELYPAEAMNQMANLTAHFFLAGFFVNVGFKFASLGVQLIAADKKKEIGSTSSLPAALRPNPPPGGIPR